jgi:hypothetical protein
LKLGITQFRPGRLIDQLLDLDERLRTGLSLVSLNPGAIGQARLGIGDQRIVFLFKASEQ